MRCQKNEQPGELKTGLDPVISDEILLDNLIEMADLCIFWKDKRRRYLGCNQAFLHYFGLTEVEEICGKADQEFDWRLGSGEEIAVENALLTDGIAVHNYKKSIYAKGQWRKIVVNEKPIYVEDKIVGLLGYFKDITQEGREQHYLETLAYTDSLTGLYNRRAFVRTIARYEDEYERNRIDFSLLFIDINGFKKYNDTYGHSFGDEVLRRVAACIRRVTGYTGVACRIGGDEFVIIHQDRNQNYIKDAENKLHQAAAEIEFIQKRPCKLELAMGWAVYSEVNDREELLRFADQRMYLNKQKRR